MDSDDQKLKRKILQVEMWRKIANIPFKIAVTVASIVGIIIGIKFFYTASSYTDKFEGDVIFLLAFILCMLSIIAAKD